MWDLRLDQNARSCADERDLGQALADLLAGSGQQLTLEWTPRLPRPLDRAIDTTLGLTDGGTGHTCTAERAGERVRLQFRNPEVTGTVEVSRSEALLVLRAFLRKRRPPGWVLGAGSA